MSFQNFKSIADVQQKYNIVYAEDEFISPLALAPSPSFLEDYEFSIEYLDVLVSEASRCENIIYPVLRDVYRHYANALSLWSHKGINADSILSATLKLRKVTSNRAGGSVWLPWLLCKSSMGTTQSRSTGL